MRQKMKILNEFHNTKQYLSKYWNNQKTTKYLIDINDKIIEAGYFIHYLGDEVVRHIVELSTSYGCSMKCKFCASSAITPVNKLSVAEIREVFDYIYLKNDLSTCNYVLVTMTGIGELYYTNKNVKEFILTINENYNNLRFATSSCCMDSMLFSMLEEIDKQVVFDNIQITHLSTDTDKVKFLVPGIPKIVTASDISKLIYASEVSVTRINYLLIKDINDSIDDIDDFIKYYLPVKDKIVIKISTLNATNASRSNQVESGSLDKAKDFCVHLEKAGFTSYVFHAFLDDKMNCGQLVSEQRVAASTC